MTSKTIRLAGLLGVERVVMMSGCPGGPGDANANWVTTAWPPEAARVLTWQWDEVLIPYWKGLVAEASAAGVTKLCLELHGQQNVYNVATLFRLRDAVGETIGANFRSEPPVLDGRRSARCNPRAGRRRSIMSMPRTRGSIASSPRSTA